MANSEQQSPGQYVVVARRYRPQAFDELLGQEHVAKALKAAISSDRVGHAYLFTGARGVGKTSAARILAKALCCVEGPTETPCGVCDICQSIAAGGDVDVLEIDGASNRGIEEIRQLRSNVGIRPSRARYKIYIIDEVHMLTREAFNALLKTLEEPPEHVKFIFCTTEATKIPVTVLSRCQRFDFAGIQPASIAKRLAEIVQNEGLTAEPEALAILARRAAGSMRDSQSLLEQLLSYGGQEIRVADVHALLGTADTQRLLKLAELIAAGDAAAALGELDTSVQEGVDVGEMLEQLLALLRDAMTALAGCRGDVMSFATSTAEQDAVTAIGQSLGLERILAMLQVVEETLSRMRYSTHRRTLVEVALVRLCRMEDLESLASLAASLAQGIDTTAAAAEPPKKKPLAEPVTPRPVAAVPPPHVVLPTTPAPRAQEWSGPQPSAQEAEDTVGQPEVQPRRPMPAQSPEAIWRSCLEKLGGLIAAKGKNFHKVALQGDRLEVAFAETYNFCKSFFEQAERRQLVERTLTEITGTKLQPAFVISQSEGVATAVAEAPRTVSPTHRWKAVQENPMVRRASELFGGRVEIVD